MPSCTDKVKPYFKIGDSFSVPIELVNPETNTNVEITPNMSFECSIVDVSGQEIASPSITPYPDQVANKGWLLMEVPTSVTETWKVGKARFDIKVIIDSAVRHTQDFTFEVRESITK